MHITGVTSDIPVRNLAESRSFYATVLGRDPDLTPNDRTLEWILHRDPEIAVRLTAQIDSPQAA
jgi:hypothetical protein